MRENVSVCVRTCPFTCKDAFRAPGLVGAAVCIEVDVTVSSSQSEGWETRRISGRGSEVESDL